MKKIFTLLLAALLFSMMSFAAKTTAIVTAGANASYTTGEILTVTGLSAEEVGYNGSLTLIVYGWDNTGGTATGYAGTLQLAGEEAAFCDEGLMITKTQDLITITGKMLGYPYDYQLNVQVNPKKASTIEVVSNNMEIAPDFWEPQDLKLTAYALGYAIEITLFGGMEKQYGTYSANALFATIDNTSVSLVEGTTAVFSQEGDLAKFEAAFVYGIDTLNLTLIGKPYTDPANITPTDTVQYTIYEAYIGKMSGFNTVFGTNDAIEINIQVPNGNWLNGVDESSFSYGSYVKVAGQKLTILRGNLKVVEADTNKSAAIGILGSDHVWYSIHATTAEEVNTSLDNIHSNAVLEKVIENGQVVIIYKGVKYNALGIIINQ